MPGYPQGAPFQPQSAPHMPGYPQGAPFQPQPVPTMPALPQGFPSFDPNDPMAAVLAMQAMGFPGLPGFPQPFGAGPPAQNKPVGVEGVDYVFMPSGERRCRSYVVNGYCPKGAYCPQDHGPDAQMRSVDPVTGTSTCLHTFSPLCLTSKLTQRQAMILLILPSSPTYSDSHLHHPTALDLNNLQRTTVHLQTSHLNHPTAIPKAVHPEANLSNAAVVFTAVPAACNTTTAAAVRSSHPPDPTPILPSRV